MGRTTVNLIGNCVATTVVARWEDAFDDDKMKLYVKNKGKISNRYIMPDVISNDDNLAMKIRQKEKV